MPVKKDPSKRSKDGTGYYIETARKTGNRNKAVYDSHLLRMPKGYKDKLTAYIQEQLNRIAEIEQSAPGSDELKRLKRLYTYTDRHTPNINNLLMQLLQDETGIIMDVPSYQSPEEDLVRPRRKKDIGNPAEE